MKGKKRLRITKVNDSEMIVEDMEETKEEVIDNEAMQELKTTADEYTKMKDMCKDMGYESVEDALTDLGDMKQAAKDDKKDKKASDEDENKDDKDKKKTEDSEPDFSEIEKAIASIKDVKTRDAVAQEFTKVRDSLKGYVKGEDITAKLIEAVKAKDAQPGEVVKTPRRVSYADLVQRKK